VRQRARAISGRSHVEGVVLDDGTRLAAGTVVLAAGCWSGQVTGPDGGPLAGLAAVRPVKGQVLRLRVAPGVGPFLGHTVRGRVHGWPVYLVPRADGTVVVGATQEERGYDETVTAGGVHQLLRDACELVPGAAELTWVEARAGLRPGSPDNAPLVGAAAPPGPSGLVLATGHHRNGVLLAPVTADAVVSLVVDGAVSGPMRAFAPSRFAAVAGDATSAAAGVTAGAPAGGVAPAPGVAARPAGREAR
jgi:glycine oxidase